MTDKSELYRRGREVLGPAAGGLIAKLLIAKDSSPVLALDVIEAADECANPAAYVAAVVKRDTPAFPGVRGDDWW